MHQLYSLLRDNKQTGPYSLADLVQTPLKPFDLIWTEGKSGGWRYPSEIDELRNYVQKEDVPAHQKISNKRSIINIPAPNAGKVSLHHPVNGQDRLPRDSKSIYVSLPAGTSIPTAQLPAEIQQETPEAKLERKALELFQKAQPYSAKENRQTKSKDSETKYTRSLVEIKEEYSTWLKQQKRENTHIGKKHIAFAALIVALTGLAIVGLYNIPTSIKAVQRQTTALQPAPEVKRNFSADALTATNETDTTFGTTQLISNEKVETAADLHINAGKENSANKTAATIRKQDSIVTKSELKKEAALVLQQPLDQSKKTPETIVPAGTEINRDTKPVPLTQQINIEGKEISNSINEGIKSYQITVRNNSNQVLKVVAVDVFYHQQNGSLLEKKTLYFSDVQPNRTLTLAAPGNKNAFSVTHQLGLVSSAGGSLYVSG